MPQGRNNNLKRVCGLGLYIFADRVRKPGLHDGYGPADQPDLRRWAVGSLVWASRVGGGGEAPARTLVRMAALATPVLLASVRGPAEGSRARCAQCPRARALWGQPLLR